VQQKNSKTVEELAREAAVEVCCAWGRGKTGEGRGVEKWAFCWTGAPLQRTDMPCLRKVKEYPEK
jgi:hypothetical protein